MVERQCVSCRKKFSRDNLIRVTLENKSSQYIVEPGKKELGRSFYFCKNQSCFQALAKNKRYKFFTQDKNMEKVERIINGCK